ncbi:MAG: radical SAM protein [Bryobacterales bacterium]|nr:radical SAM protein [Bryobacterales bacterium]
MRVLLIQLDGKLPNLALMRIASHHRQRCDTCELRFGAQFEVGLWDDFGAIYGSAIFVKTRPLVARLFSVYPRAIVGGTGYDVRSTVESHGITTQDLDYSLYPAFRQSIGFTQRGCRLRCPFCVVPEKEGRVRAERTVHEIWRGDPWPRELLLLDNDFFGQPHWRDRMRELREGRFKVSLNQGINCRCLTEEAAEAIASVDYRDDSMQVKRIYTARDSKADETQVFAGLDRLVKHGVKPDHIMVYMLIGYWPGETHEDRDYRRKRLRDFGARPYPMPYVRTLELVGFQRWVVGAYDKRVPWRDWSASAFEPRKLGSPQQTELLPLLQ